MSNLKCKKPKLCVQPPAPEPVPCSPAFDLCVGDRTLVWNGFCPTIKRERKTPDGTYTSVTVVDGCIVSYGYAEEPTYTPAYCNPNPTHCQETGTGVSTNVTISPNPDNTLLRTVGGLMARTYIHGGNGVTVGGTGTLNNPYIVSIPDSVNTGRITSVVGRNGLISETKNNVTYVGLQPSGAKAGVYDITDQFTVDKYGRITSVEGRSTPLISAGAGLTVDTLGDTIQLSHSTFNLDGDMVLGAFNVTVNDSGHITDTERLITITEGTYHIGAYNVTLNEYGSVSNIIQRTDVMPSSGTFRTLDGKTISYDVTGRLTNIEDQEDQVLSSAAPLPIRDMFKVTPANNAAGKVMKEIYGADIQMVMRGKNVVITIPSYVVQRNQIELHGARSWDLNVLQGTITVVPQDLSSFTITFRG